MLVIIPKVLNIYRSKYILLTNVNIIGVIATIVSDYYMKRLIEILT